MGLGFVFPGQGAQSVGMLADLLESEPVVRACFEQAEQAIGEPLLKYISEGPEARLNETEITQPVVLTASVALWRLWQERGGATPELLAGHSLGEYSALVCGGALSFADGVELVNLRGQYMQQAVPLGEGAVAAILGLTDEQVQQCCASVEGVVTPANYNAPGQVAIAGSMGAVNLAIDACKEAGAKRAVMLTLSVPVHCPLMEPAGERLLLAIEGKSLQMPQIPIVHNADGKVAADVGDLKEKLLAQLAQPVLWVDCVQAMMSQGVDQLVECGPGKVLAGLIKRIERKLPVVGIDSSAALGVALESMSGSGDKA